MIHILDKCLRVAANNLYLDISETSTFIEHICSVHTSVMGYNQLSYVAVLIILFSQNKHIHTSIINEKLIRNIVFKHHDYLYCSQISDLGYTSYFFFKQGM